MTHDAAEAVLVLFAGSATGETITADDVVRLASETSDAITVATLNSGEHWYAGLMGESVLRTVAQAIASAVAERLTAAGWSLDLDALWAARAIEAERQV